MKKLLLAVAAVAVMVGFSSCSTGRYLQTSTNLNMNQTQVVLSSNNFKVVKTVTAYTEFKQNMKFDSEQLKQSAYAALLKKTDLQGSQTLVNVTIEQVNRETAPFLGVLGTRKYQTALLVTGTVIEFTK